MKGKKTVLKKIAVMMLAMSMVFSDVSVYAEDIAEDRTDSTVAETGPENEDTIGLEEQTVSGNEPGTQAEAPEDLSGLLTVEEMEALEPEQVGATRWFARTLSLEEEGVQPEDNNWSFNAYYVNQPDSHDVTMTNNFNLKYQMEFHASRDFQIKEVMIRIERELLLGRPSGEGAAGKSYVPLDIAVPRVTKEEAEQGQYSANRTTPFNYYIEEAEGKEYLVFFNYRKITSGSNAAWQILYKNLKLMDIKDGTDWTLHPEVSVNGGTDYREAAPLTGRVDSSVSITSVTKRAYAETGRNYTPGLYTVAQLKQYLSEGQEIDGKYIDAADSKKLSTDYRFVVWEVAVKGNATQPWSLYVWDAPMISERGWLVDCGEVVGYRDYSDNTLGYNVPIIDKPGTKSSDEIGVMMLGMDTQWAELGVVKKEETWGSRFYVVTAYPADRVSPDTEVMNQINVAVVPADGLDGTVQKGAPAAGWTYRDYDWNYSGNVLGIEKKTDKPEYTGWLEAYHTSRIGGEDYGSIPYTTKSWLYGYSLTHHEKGSLLGRYKENTYYTHTTVDDFLYAYSQDIKAWEDNDGYAVLDWKDYYFSAVTVSQTDYGYDVFEDRMTESEVKELREAGKLPADFDSSVHIYAMFGDSGNPNEWVEVLDGNGNSFAMDESGKMTYTFTEEQIAKKPWRVKVVHNAVDYESACKIDVNVCMRHDSPVMATIIENRRDVNEGVAGPGVQIENISGTVGVAYTENGNTVYFKDNGTHSDNYSEPGLREMTENLYKGDYGDNWLLMRDSAIKNVTWLNMAAASFKEAKSTNDVDNNRVLVDYYLTAYDGYEIYDRECLDYLSERDKELISPGRSHVVFYDLLPYGVRFDASYPVTAGRITNLDENGNYKVQSRSWDSAQTGVQAKVIDTDYRGTGRTLLAFYIEYTGADSTSYTNRKWIEGWGVTFRTYYDWKDIDTISKNILNANISAFMPDFRQEAYGNHSHPALCGLKTQVEMDNGEFQDQELARSCGDLVKAFIPEGGTEERKGNIDGLNPQDKEGKFFDSTYRNVLYARSVLQDDIAVSSNSKLGKLVRADSDIFGVFSESAVVETEEGYTYDITVTAGTAAGGIVVFDKLENAHIDRVEFQNDADGNTVKVPVSGELFDFADALWQGTFQAVDVSALEKLGIKPVVYYSNRAKDQVVTTGKGSNAAPETVLTEDNGWYTEEAYGAMVEAGQAAWSQVTAVAVDLSKKADGTSFVLEANHSAAFRIKMKAPAWKEEWNSLTGGRRPYTYNNASFSSCPAVKKVTTDENGSSVSVWENKTGERTTEECNSVRVGLGAEEKLEVVKRISGQVPGSQKDAEFTFRLYEEGTGELDEQPLAYREYSLFRLSDGKWTEVTDRIYATDPKGYLTLHGDEKAVFRVVDAGRIQVEETENVFWESRKTKEVLEDENGNVRTVTVWNSYRPVLYAQKQLSGVPEGVQLSESARTFTFKLEKKNGSGQYVPVKNSEFWYVDRARYDGAVPVKLGTGKTGEDGTFRIKEGEVIALFPGTAGTEYRLSELQEEGGDWVCLYPEAVGKIPVRGDGKTITNYYRWKDLYLTKTLTHQAPEDCNQAFTFRVIEPVLDDNGDVVLDIDGMPVGKTKDADTGLDNEGKPVQQVTTAGLEWVLTDENGNEIGTEAVRDENGNIVVPATKGKLDGNGSFTCAFAGKTVKIKGLEAGKNYLVKEIVTGDENGVILYLPENDTQDVTMPVFGTGEKLEFINDYQKRPLSVSKTVISGNGAQKEDGENGKENGKENGIEDGIKAKFRFKVWKITTNAAGSEIEEPLTGPLQYTISKAGTGDMAEAGPAEGVIPEGQPVEFELAGGETITFQDAGMLGDVFVVREAIAAGSDCIQQFPSGDPDMDGYGAPGRVELEGEGGEVTFVNAESKSLNIVKRYVAEEEDENADKFIEDMKNAVMSAAVEFYGEEQDGIYEDWDLLPDFSDWGADVMLWNSQVMFELEITKADGSPYTEPMMAIAVNELTGESFSFRWRTVGEEVSYYQRIIYPWIKIIISDLPEGAQYTLREYENYQHRIIVWDSSDSGSGMQRAISKPNGESGNVWLELSQYEPADDGPVIGNVEENPEAAIYNKVSSVNKEGSRIIKIMNSQSSPVASDARLVWRLEKYDGNSGKWIPAEGIRYVPILWEDHHYESNDIPCVEVAETGADGRIVLSGDMSGNTLFGSNFQPEKGNVGVRFTENKVYVNLYRQKDIERLQTEGQPLLRLTEIPEESDPTWGLLAGYYCINQSDLASPVPQNSRVIDREVPYGCKLDASVEEAAGFVNSNQTKPVEIEKYMESGDDEEEFVMVLKQILSASRDPGDESFARSDILAVRPGDGIRYTVYDSLTGEAVEGLRNMVVKDGGRIKLCAGQFARLELPAGTAWTVSEDEGSLQQQNYSFEKMEGKNASAPILRPLDRNLMLINMPVNTRYTVVWRDEKGEILHHEIRYGELYSTVRVKEEDKTLLGSEWIFDREASGNRLSGVVQKDGTTELCLYFKNVYGSYTVSWHDAKNGDEILGRETRSGIKGSIVSVTEADKTRDGWIFVEDDSRNCLSETVADDGTTELKLYFRELKPVTITCNRQYYNTSGVRIATIYGSTEGNEFRGMFREGDTISTRMIAQKKPAWNNREEDGVERTFVCAGMKVGTTADEADEIVSYTISREDAENGLTITLIYREAEGYTVTYTDGVKGDIVFGDEVHGGLSYNAPTPKFTGNLTRKGFIFTGWSPAVTETVTGDVTYMATWEKETP